jgi:hypothetical protein
MLGTLGNLPERLHSILASLGSILHQSFARPAILSGRPPIPIGFYKKYNRRKCFLTPKAVAKRRQWVEVNKDRELRWVIFTDKSTIEMGLDIAMNWTNRRAGEESLPKNLLMLWGGRQLFLARSGIWCPWASHQVKCRKRGKEWMWKSTSGRSWRGQSSRPQGSSEQPGGGTSWW